MSLGIEIFNLEPHEASPIAERLLSLDTNSSFRRVFESANSAPGDQACFLIKKHESYIGFALLVTNESHAEIYRFYIIPDIRRTGAGKSAVQKLITVLKEYDFKTCALQIDDNIALSFWEAAFSESQLKINHIYENKYEVYF